LNKKIPIFPIIKVASSCNLSCSYCSAEEYMEHNRKSIMTKETAKRVVEELARVRDGGTFLWHGGEALLAGQEFYQFVIDLQKSLELTGYRNDIQTNAVLITDNWTQFLKDSGFQIGISIDGPDAIHNELRVFSNGAGSHKQVMRGAEKLQDNSVHFGVLVVVTKQSCKYPKEIFSFMLEHGIKSFDFKPCYGDPRYDVSLVDFAKFMIQIFDLWEKLDDPQVHIRILEGFMRNLLGSKASVCSQNGNCKLVVTINHNGDVYPCDRFIEPAYKYGNINETPLDELYEESEGSKAFSAHVDQQRTSCEGCSYRPVCQSGCTQERDYWPEEYCEHRILMIDHIRSWLIEQGEHPVSVN